MFNTQCSIFNGENIACLHRSYPTGSAPYCALANASFCCRKRVAQYSACSSLLYQPVKENSLMQPVIQNVGEKIDCLQNEMGSLK
jgi:hypothetical protein